MLWFLLLPLVLVVFAITGEYRRRRSFAVFGERKLTEKLSTFDASPRRTVKNALLVIGLVFAIFSTARPHYGKGTKVVPATAVNAVIALDHSKSMYAQDVMPSRITRARNDATRMISSLPTIRWGAVVFAGEAFALPPTSDINDAAQFLRSREPNDMPGGTAIARALDLATHQLVPEESIGKKRLLEKNVIVLVTDGEDLEGDPVEAAKVAAESGITIHVVAIGRRAPQPIPAIDSMTGKPNGFLHDDDGTQIMTELSPEGEQRLKEIARIGHGVFVQSNDNSTGLTEVESAIRAMILSEGTTRTEDNFPDVFMYPLAIAILLLLCEALIAESPARKRRPHVA
jgi:Ca-activated chloride channel family protein